MRRSWGKPVRARIQLRRTLGREATRDEVDNAQGAFKNVTEEDIMAALDAGEEVSACCQSAARDDDVY